MDSFALSLPSLSRVAVGGPDRTPTRRERLAIVSTADRLCGIAAYTAALREQLSHDFDVTVLDLDQYLLRGQHASLRPLADRHIKELCCELARFDAVNLQLEYGTLGRSARDIYRRFCWLVAAAPRLCITFHTLVPPPRFPAAELVRAMAAFDLRRAVRVRAEFRRNNVLSVMIAAQLRRSQRTKQVTAIAHTRRNRRELNYVYGLEHVFDHPLAFLPPTRANAIRNGARRRNFPLLERLPDHATLIGVFGFINSYKGVGTAILALRHLPDDHHLLIFGGIHPNEIVPRQPIHPHLSSLYEEAYVDATPYDRIIGQAPQPPVKLMVNGDQGLAGLLAAHPRDLSSRIHFMGAADDHDFLHGMATCDVVVFPYIEVGQSASGPISQALELGCRIIASRTHTFLSFAEYHRDAIEFFDIGNYLELAARIRARRQFAPRQDPPAYNVETNRAVYVAANSRLPALRRSGGKGSITVPQGSMLPAHAVQER